MPKPCGCTLDTRCAFAWQIKEHYDATALDGSARQRHARLDLVHRYGAHLRSAGLSYVHMGSLAHPLFTERDYPRPTPEEAPHA